MSNYSDKDITIPAKTIISQLSLGNKIPKMIYPGDEKDSELLYKDEGLKYEHFEQHKLISEELKLEPEEYILPLVIKLVINLILLKLRILVQI